MTDSYGRTLAVAVGAIAHRPHALRIAGRRTA